MYFGKIQKGSDWFFIVTNINYQHQHLLFFLLVTNFFSFSFGQIPKDTERLEGVIAMIDTWSMAYSCLVCVVSYHCYHHS